MKTQVTNHLNRIFQAGTYEFSGLQAGDYVVAITARNGGPTALSLKGAIADSDGIEDTDFISGSPYGAIITIPMGFYLVVTLAGAEEVSIRIHRRADA